jgi:hypothetical protein
VAVAAAVAGAAVCVVAAVAGAAVVVALAGAAALADAVVLADAVAPRVAHRALLPRARYPTAWTTGSGSPQISTLADANAQVR